MAKTPRQLIDQSTRHAVHLERLKSHDVKAYEDLLRKMESYVKFELSGKDLSEWRLNRLNKLTTAINKALSETHRDIREIWHEQIIELAQYESAFELRSLGKVSKYDFDLPSNTQLRAAIFNTPLQATGPYQGVLLDSFFDGWSARSMQRLEGAIKLGYAQGKTTPAIVRDLFDSGGVMDTTRRDLNSVVRTSLQHCASISRNETWKANSDIVKRVRIVATLDNRTSSTCRSLDGQEFPLDKGPRPPFHINCRTTTVAALDERFSILEEGGQRVARDPETGEVDRVPANQTYYSWLKNQPKDVQDDILGPTRGSLLRNGGLSAERFAELQIGKQYEPLTLEEMRDLEPVAFSRAGL